MPFDWHIRRMAELPGLDCGESQRRTVKTGNSKDDRKQSGAESGARSADPRLAAIIEAWPTLPEEVREKLAGKLNWQVQHDVR
jgi:hypothetical protein